MAQYRPSREEFERLAAEYPIVPVWREVIADLETPVSAFSKLAAGIGGGRHAFLLESVEGGERWGRYSFIGVDPFLVMVCRDGVVSWEGTPPAAAAEMPEGSSPLEVLRTVLESYRTPVLAGLPPLHAGAVGYLGYDVVRYLERLPQTTTDEVGVPEMMLMFPRSLVVFDHLRQRIAFVANVIEGDSYDEAVARSEELVAALGQPLPYQPLELPPVEVALPPSSMRRDEFEAAVEAAREYIVAGDIFQVVIAQRFSAPIRADPLDVYRVLRLVNPSPYMFYLRHPDITVIGSSPEPLIKVQQGSVKVEELMVVERYSHIMHLVSQVSGELAEGRTALDALYASFPAGTVSGAPKIRAMEIIDELEPTRRGPYAGIVGYFDFSGNLDTCIALRTAYIAGGTFHIQAGGGIVADSEPSKEYWESVNKAKALLTAAQIAERLR